MRVWDLKKASSSGFSSNKVSSRGRMCKGISVLISVFMILGSQARGFRGGGGLGSRGKTWGAEGTDLLSCMSLRALFPAGFTSIDRFLQNRAPILCLCFDGIGARHPGMTHHKPNRFSKLVAGCHMHLHPLHTSRSTSASRGATPASQCVTYIGVVLVASHTQTSSIER